MREASHVVFDGHLDDPAFREIAIQKIVALTETTVTLEKSGALEIINRSGNRQQVRTSFTCPIFGKQETLGTPFKDDHAEAISK